MGRRYDLVRTVLLGGCLGTASLIQPAWGEAPLRVVYPPADHQTTADQIFLIGTGDPNAPVVVNGSAIADRSPTGNFAPSFPLDLGENTFTVTQGSETITLTVTRLSNQPELPAGNAFVAESLQPAVDIARMPGELICLGAIAPADAQVSATVGSFNLPLQPQTNPVDLPANSAVLTDRNAPQPQPTTGPIPYEGCFRTETPGNLGTPSYRLSRQGETLTQQAPGRIAILPDTRFTIAEVTATAGVARTGPSTSYSRITPLPQGTRAAITGREGDWLRLDYGGWIRASETRSFASAVPPHSLIRGISSRQVDGWSEVYFPLQVPVPVSIDQSADTLTLTLYNTTPQTDTIYLGNDPLVERLDWEPVLPDQAQYTFHFKTTQQWGYKLRYEGTTLVLSLKHPPELTGSAPLAGTTILVDPGHGGDELGATGPDGTPEKAINLAVSLLLRDELERRGATVIMTREADEAVGVNDRAEQINQDQPTLALSIHYNALPDDGDALHTAGVGAFWYNAQAHDLATFLHDYLVARLNRPSYGVFWNNLALTRPHVAPSVLLELGFMINPTEFEWVSDPSAQQQLAIALADGIATWVNQQVPSP